MAKKGDYNGEVGPVHRGYPLDETFSLCYYTVVSLEDWISASSLDINMPFRQLPPAAVNVDRH